MVTAFAIRRILWLIPTLLAIYTVTFFVMHATPGGPWDLEHVEHLHPQVVENIKAQYGMDRPLTEQYATYLWRTVRHGDLGVSFGSAGRTVNEIVADYFPTSAQLGGMAILVAVVVGVFLGVLGAIHVGKWIDYLATFLAVIGVSTPSFVVAILLVVVFAIQLQWVPFGVWEGVLSRRAILPVVALSLGPMALIARYTRSSMLNILNMDYIRTARAKGLSERVVLYKHAFRNALIPVITLLGISFARVVVGSFFVESIVMIPGIGRYFVNSVFGRDYPVIMGLTLLYALIIVSVNLVVDLSYAWIDPRVRYS